MSQLSRPATADEQRDFLILAGIDREEWPGAWVQLIEQGIRSDPATRYAFLARLTAAAEHTYWVNMRFFAGSPGAIDERPAVSPECWAEAAADMMVEDVRRLLVRTNLTPFEAETIMGNYQYTANAIMGRDSRPLLRQDLDDLTDPE